MRHWRGRQRLIWILTAVVAFFLIQHGLEPQRPHGNVQVMDADGKTSTLNCDLVISQLQPVCRGEPTYWQVAAGIVILFLPLYERDRPHGPNSPESP